MLTRANYTRVIEKMGEGMRIHMSGVSKALLDKVGGFRCEYRGLLDLGVIIFISNTSNIFHCSKKYFPIVSLSEATWSRGG